MKDGQRQGCDEIFFLLYAALYSGRPDILLQGMQFILCAWSLQGHTQGFLNDRVNVTDTVHL